MPWRFLKILNIQKILCNLEPWGQSVSTGVYSEKQMKKQNKMRFKRELY